MKTTTVKLSEEVIDKINRLFELREEAKQLGVPGYNTDDPYVRAAKWVFNTSAVSDEQRAITKKLVLLHCYSGGEDNTKKKLSPDETTTFFVLNGLQNGEEGVRAVYQGSGDLELPYKDGWYILWHGKADGDGPFVSREEAQARIDQSRKTMGVRALAARLTELAFLDPEQTTSIVQGRDFPVYVIANGIRHPVEDVWIERSSARPHRHSRDLYEFDHICVGVDPR